MALVTAAQIIDALPVHQGMDEAYITPIIEAVQVGQLRPAMASGYYDDMVASGWMTDGTISISGYDATASGRLYDMLENSIKPFLYWAVGAATLEEVGNQVGNVGLVNYTPQDGNNNEKAIARKKQTWKGYLDSYSNKLQDFLYDNRDNVGFEGYNNSKYTPSGNTLFNTLGIE